jgi:hypothetical protein
MKCKQCVKEGKKSCVFVEGKSSTCLATSQPFYDEDGNYHNHDRNIMTTFYKCSNDHSWVEKSKPSCWCGWPDDLGKVKNSSFNEGNKL